VSEEVPLPVGPLSDAEQSIASALTAADLQTIDAAIIATTPNQSRTRSRKVIAVAMRTEEALKSRYPGLSFVFYIHRLIHLVDEGRLEADGNPEYPRFSEVRVP
jgi:hypothetical protein